MYLLGTLLKHVDAICHPQEDEAESHICEHWRFKFAADYIEISVIMCQKTYILHIYKIIYTYIFTYIGL